MIKPRKLNPGDTIAIISPSSPTKDSSAVPRGKAFLESLGYNVVLGKELSYKRLFVGFTSGIEFALRLFFTLFFTIIFIVAWSFLLIVPGIMKAYSYRVVPYVFLDNPEISPLEAIKKSKEMMYGHRWELFVLELRFIPWFLLGIITLGIGFIWIVPYFMTAYSEFYIQLKEKQP